MIIRGMNLLAAPLSPSDPSLREPRSIAVHETGKVGSEPRCGLGRVNNGLRVAGALSLPSRDCYFSALQNRASPRGEE